MATVKPHDVQEWWRETAETDLQGATAKALEYGSRGEDLAMMGRWLAGMASIKVPEGVDPDQFYTELGIHQYLVGKMTRAAEAFRTGRMPSDDTYLDICVYGMMARRAREAGYWG